MVAHKKRRKKTFNYVLYVMYVLLLLVLIGDIIGSSLYVKLEQASQTSLMSYVGDNISSFDPNQWSFNKLFYKQFMYQGSMWVLGLSIIGIVVNLFLVFLKGVIAGFNVFFIFQTLSPLSALITSFLWLLQYLLILGVTILSGYFSIRFVILLLKIIFVKKNNALLQKHFLYYFYQLVIVMVLTLVTSGLTYFIQPVVYHQFEKAGQTDALEAKESADDFLSTHEGATSDVWLQIDVNFDSEVI